MIPRLESPVTFEDGFNNIPPKIIKKCKFYSGERKENDTDVSIILGADSDQLLLMRFHKRDDVHSRKNPFANVPPAVENDLFYDLKENLSRGGFEGYRFGGSGGQWKGPTKSFFQFLNHAGNLPTKAIVRKKICFHALHNLIVTNNVFVKFNQSRLPKLFPCRPRCYVHISVQRTNRNLSVRDIPFLFQVVLLNCLISS